jgi:hypothetical protein
MTDTEKPRLELETVILAAFRKMDDETKHEAVEILKNLARDFPRAPRLRLVSQRST